MVTPTLTLRVATSQGTTEQTYARTPVFVGRSVGPGHCNIEDRSASKLHASVDIRVGQICVRDAASTNGTFSKGQRLDPDRWTALGPVGTAVEFRIGGAAITAWVTEQVESAGAASSGTLSELLSGVGSAVATPQPGRPEAVTVPRFVLHRGPNAAPADAGRGVMFDRRPSHARVAPACHDALNALSTLEATVDRELAAAPVHEKEAICRELAQAYPKLAECEGLLNVFEAHGVNLRRPAARIDPLAAAAMAAFQELAVWYTGADRTITEPAEMKAFQLRLQTTLDDLLLGYAPLLTGLNRFESQMEIRMHTGGGDSQVSAADLAAALLDWRKNDEPMRTKLRASFGELMMHQVALLRGVMRGVKTLLAELAPAVIEQAAEQEATPQGSVRRLFARADPWATYKRRHSDLSDEENETFRLLFGADFVNEYRQFSQESRLEQGPERAGSAPR